jgi:hypothetical protein
MKYFGWRGILSLKKNADTDTETTNEINNDENGDENGDNDINNDELKSKLVFHSKIRQSCSREQHAVWACRSVSTGCGKDLSLLKRCFEDIDTTEIEKLPPHYRILTTPYTNYEGIVEKTEEEEAQAQSLATITTSTTTSVDKNAKSSSSSLSSSLSSLKQRIPCYDIQRQLGSCVTINGKQLLERKQKREENNK